MPTDEDYGRRQVSLQHASTSPAPVPCPAGCPAVPGDHLQSGLAERYQSDRLQQERYSSDKQISERFEPPERFQVVSDRFGSERSNSDRLPSGERYHGVSERYPLGERPQAAISSDRLSKEIAQTCERQNFQPERYQYPDRTCQRYPERFATQNVGSLDRYHNHPTLERYSRTNTPTDRYHTLSNDKERCSSSNADRYTPEKYSNGAIDFNNERHESAQSVCSVERYTPTERHRYGQNEREAYNGSKTLPSEVYKIRERSGSSDRKSGYNERYQNRYNHEFERYNAERFPPIPCPERFAGQERNERAPFSQVSYMEPPSPAPASDRFIPPPPLSPTNTPSPDCYPANPFPSPTNVTTVPERFIPPPPLSPSPTEAYSPKKLERYDKRDRYQFTTSPNSNDRYSQYDRFKDRNQYYNNERYLSAHPNQNGYHSHTDKFNDRYSNTNERYIPPNAHTPVERYVPQQQEHYYGTYQAYDRYQKFNTGDPYMRRDLNFHYRLPVPYPQNQFQRMRFSHMCTPSRVRCCQYQEGYQLTKSSPGSSSSSSVTSQGKEIQNFHAQKELAVTASTMQEIQCQNFQAKEYQCPYQQEKGIQCTNLPNKELQCVGFHIITGKDGKDSACPNFTSPNLRKGQCRHGICGSPSVEYVGQSGGRLVCATPPPRGSVGSAEIAICSDQCCTKRGQNSLAVTVW